MPGLALLSILGAASGEPLRVATKPFVPLVFEQDGLYQGFSIDVWDQIAQDEALPYTLIGTESVGELLELVADGSVDMAVAGVTITAAREQRVDFTHSFYETGLQVMVRDQQETGSLQSVAQAFITWDLLKIFAAGFLVILTSAHLLWFAERRRGSDVFPHDYVHGIWETFWWAVVTVTTVGYGDKIPRTWLGRLVAMGWMWAGIILFSFFIATVTANLTVQQLQGHIAGPEDLPGRSAATVAGTTAVSYLRSRAVDTLEVETIEAAYAVLEAGEVEAVVYDAPVLRYHAAHAGRGSLRVIGPVFEHQSYAIVLPIGSPLREPLNQAILRLREGEVYLGLERKWFGDF